MFDKADYFFSCVTGKSCTKYFYRGRREKYQRYRFSIHQHAACTHAQHQPQEWSYSCVRDGVQPRPTQEYNAVPWATGGAEQTVRDVVQRRKAATSKNHQKSACCVTALLTGKGRRGTKRNARRKQGRRHRGMLHSRTLHHCFLHV